MQPVIRNVEDFTWIFSTIMGVFMILTIMKLAFFKSFSALNNLVRFKELEEDSLSFSLFINIILGILIGLILSPFLKIPYLYSHVFWITSVTTIIACCIIILLKSTINFIIFKYFIKKNNSKKIIRTKLFYKFYLIIVLLILTLLLYFSNLDKDYILYIFLTCYGFIWISEYYLQINNSKLNKYLYNYYFILYLCILDIMPITFVYLNWYR